MRPTSLSRGFARANVPLSLESRPFVRGVQGEQIVQIDIRRTQEKKRLREEVAIYPGRGAELLVLGTDRDIQQLVLRVREPERKFKEWRWDPKRRRSELVERRTSPAIRRFLVGMDESHLFVAQLTKPATTVSEAHEGLRPAILEERPEVARQGEWFFVPTTETERELVRHQAKRGLGVRSRIPIGQHRGMRGRPHVAEQQISVVDGEVMEFIRGSVRHPDHATLVFPEWMRVFMNTEDRTAGATWID